MIRAQRSAGRRNWCLSSGKSRGVWSTCPPVHLCRGEEFGLSEAHGPQTRMNRRLRVRVVAEICIF